MSNQQLKGHLDTLILAILEDGPSHGYSIIESLRHRSEDFFNLPEGTIYPALHRLEDAGLISSSREVFEGRDRRIYRLIPAGRKSLVKNRESWTAFSAAVTRVLKAELA